MGTYDIDFPNLGIYLKNVPQFITIGGFSIAIYGICIAAGIMAGLAMALRVAGKTGQDKDTYWDLIIWIIILSIVGARAFYVAMMWDYYRTDPIQIFNLRAGGLAVYGGIFACIIGIIIFGKVKKLNFMTLLDTCCCGLPLGQIVGRWGNFFNREVFGGYTDGLLAMRLPLEMVRARDVTEELAAHIPEGANYIQVHPTFLYEGLWNLGLLLVLLFVCRRKKFHGEVLLTYFVGYGIGRSWIEHIRTDRLYLPGTDFPASIAVSIAAIIFAVVMEIVIRRGMREGRFASLAVTVPYGSVTADSAEAPEDGADVSAAEAPEDGAEVPAAEAPADGDRTDT